MQLIPGNSHFYKHTERLMFIGIPVAKVLFLGFFFSNVCTYFDPVCQDWVLLYLMFYLFEMKEG